VLSCGLKSKITNVVKTDDVIVVGSGLKLSKQLKKQNHEGQQRKMLRTIVMVMLNEQQQQEETFESKCGSTTVVRNKGFFLLRNEIILLRIQYKLKSKVLIRLFNTQQMQ
jgi:hypothetical protein